MATNILNSSEFKWVVKFDPNTTSLDLERSEEYASKINKVVQTVIASTPSLTSREDQEMVRTFTQKLETLNGHFHSKTQKSLFGQSVEALVLSSAAFEGNYSPKVASLLKSSRLNALLRGEGNKKEALSAFLKELNGILKSPDLSKNDLAILKKLTQKCFDLSKEASDPAIDSSITESIDLVKAHIFIQAPLYQNLLNYKQGALKGKDPKVVGAELENFANQLTALVKRFPSIVSENDLLKVYGNVKGIQQEFMWQSSSFNNALAALRNIPAVREKNFKRFQAGLKSLNLDSPNFENDIAVLKLTLKEIYPPQHPELLRLMDSLDALKSQKTFAPGKSETQVVAWIQSKNQKLKNANYIAFVDDSIKSGQTKLLKLMQENSSSLEQLSGSLQKNIDGLKNEVMQTRFKALLDAYGIPYSNLVVRFPALVKGIDKFAHEAANAFTVKWGKIEEEQNLATRGQFSRVTKDLTSASFSSDSKASLVENALELVFSKLNVAKIDGNESLDSMLGSALTYGVSKLTLVFDAGYEVLYKDIHSWILKNISQIELVYDQDLDVNKNMDKGTCMQNSFERISRLCGSPTLSSKDLPVGSSQIDRFRKGRKVITTNLFHKSEQTATMLQRSAKDYGLKETAQIDLISGEEQVTSSMVEKLCDWAHKNGESQILMSFFTPGGHAINVQIDEKRGIYRFFDDNNLRTYSYPNLKAFKAEFTQYLKAFYPSMQNCQARAYKKTTNP